MEESERVREFRQNAVVAALRVNLLAGTPMLLKAIDLADCALLQGGHENKRRRVREIVAELHELGERICASDGAPERCGYWLARNDVEWARYQEARKAHARFEFVVVRDMKQAASEKATGQTRLFSEGAMDWARA